MHPDNSDTNNKIRKPSSDAKNVVKNFGKGIVNFVKTEKSMI